MIESWLGRLFFCPISFMASFDLSFSFNARYEQIGSIHAGTKHIWIVLHGYGQLAPYFIRKFQTLEASDACIVAPEGLSRFYLEGFSGRVGATWMTKEDRLRDIGNYVNYLDALYTKLLDLASDGVKVHVMAFSQGVATASRWLALGLEKKIASISFWAGVFPPDLEVSLSRERLGGIPLFYLLGNQDPFVSAQKLEEHKAQLMQIGLNIDFRVFEGKHDICTDTLKQLAEDIRDLSK